MGKVERNIFESDKLNVISNLSVRPSIFALFAIVNSLMLAVSIAIMPYWISAILILPSIFLVLLYWPASSNYKGDGLISILCTYIFVFSVWPQFSAYKVSGLPALEPQRIVYGLMLLVWLVLMFTNNAAREVLLARVRFAFIPVSCLVGLYAIHFLVAIFNDNPIWAFFFAFRELVSIVFIFPIALVAVRGIGDIRRIFLFITIGAGVVCVLAIVESILKRNLFVSWVPLSSSYAEWATAERVRDGVYRVQAVFDNPLLLVDFLIFVWPIALYVSKNAQNFFARILGVVVSFFIPLALLRTGSRSAVLVMAIQIFVYVLLWIVRSSRLRKYNGFPYLIAGLIVLSLLLVPLVFGDVKTLATGRTAEEAMSSSARMVMLTRAIDDISSGNLFGHGFSRSSSVIGIKTGAPGAWIYVLDNYFITILLDSGVLALILYCAFMFWLFRSSLIVAINSSDDCSQIASAIFVAVSGFAVVKVISSQTQVFPLFYLISAAFIVFLKSISDRKDI